MELLKDQRRLQNRDGILIREELEGFPAVIAQHEIDHLDGIRFPDRITDDSSLHWVEDGQYGEYRKGWRDWIIKCPRSRWEDMKSGK